MEVRDAVEADAGRLAAIADAPSDVMRNLVHDRTVRVAEAEPGDADPHEDAGSASDASETAPGAGGGPDAGDEELAGRDPHEDHELLGFVSFDARERTVHVTQVEGTREAVEALLAEPIRFARGEGMDVELLVPDDEDTVREAAETVGFAPAGRGPRFDGRPTTRYRLEPG